MSKTGVYKEGYRSIQTAGSCAEACAALEKGLPDFAILDIMLPDGDGFSLFTRIRRLTPAPILFLSARDEDQDRLLGLGLGADDYLTKPFLPRELLLRIAAILRRTYFPMQSPPAASTLELGNRTVHFDQGTVILLDNTGESPVSLPAAARKAAGKKACQGEIPLTAKELLILKKLNENRGKIVTFDALCDAVWGDGYYTYENTLMVHIRRLREKIEEDPSHPRFLVTARGIGYRLL